MIEKKKDARKFHQLQMICILEADFNTVLKILFAKELMAQAEKMASTMTNGVQDGVQDQTVPPPTQHCGR